MRNSPIAVAIGLILCIMLIFVTPMYYIGLMEYARSEYAVMTECRNLIDEVIDSRTLTDDMLNDFELAIAATSELYSVEIYREVKVVNPDPANPGQTYTSYQPVDDISCYNQGDMIAIKVTPAGSNFVKVFAARMLGLSYGTNSFTFEGRVR